MDLTRALRAGLLVTAAALASCAIARSQEPSVDERRGRVRPSVERYFTDEGSPFRVHTFRFTLASTTIDVRDVGMTRAVTDALRGSPSAVLAVNGGFFDTLRRPEGLVVANRREIAPFAPTLGGGVFTIAARAAALHAAEEWPARASGTEHDFAIQGRPRLVVEGRNNIRRSDGYHADRTALCTRDRGATLDVIIVRSDHEDGSGGPTLYQLGDLLVRHGCETALNLDGGPSTGAAWRDRDGLRTLAPRAPIRHVLVLSTR